MPALFEEFCEYFNYKLSWGMSQNEWTQLIFRFFEEQATKEKLLVETNYMLVDQVWRGQSYREIVFALEHEHVGTDVNELLNKEVDHLVDLRARTKVGIFYPNLGDEKALVDNIATRISSKAIVLRIPGEQYMFILGYDTRKQRERAVQFKAHFFDEYGKKTDHKEHVIFQAHKSEADASP